MAIACSRSGQKCAVCGGRATKLCDYPLRGSKEGQTCDRPLCARHAKSIGPGIDYCPAHARLAEKEGSENGNTGNIGRVQQNR